MRHSTGIYNNHGYVQIRIWPQGSTVSPKPYTEGKFGCWCKEHIGAAETRLVELRKLIKDGLFDKDKPKPLQFGEAWDLFYKKHYLLKQRSAGSRTNAMSYGKQFKAFPGWKDKDLDCAPWFAKELHQFIPNDFRGYIAYRASLRVGPADIVRHLSILESLFNRFTEWLKCGDIDPVILPPFNPVEPVERPSLAGTKRERIANRQELAALKAWCAANDPDLGALIGQALVSFLRAADLTAVQGKSQAKGFAGKTGKAFHLSLNVSTKLKTRNRPRRWAKAKAACGIVDLNWHDLRHSGATMARAAGVSIDLIQEALQHSSVEQTLDYLNARAERLAPIAEKVQAEWDSL
jgi:integrase